MISAIVPAHNEEKTILSTVSRLQEYCTQVIVVDDGSEDDTYFMLDGSSATVIRKNIAQGKGAAIRTGYRFVDKFADYVLLIDADQFNPKEIETFLNVMKLYNADAVIGSKKHEYSVVDYSPLRRVMSECYRFFIWCLFGLPLRDTQCGFKLFKREALDKVLSKVLTKQFAFDLELLVCMREQKFRVVDSPVFVYKAEKSSVRMGHIFQTLVDTLSVFYRKQKGWYR
ncbi:MAG TPA: glycosyltransferase family 2 protein [Candidatus Omnitrophota bacterium]|nr:glycosyltransferase family 2 protein [Candidatus Omnitrophota bacterium]